MKSYTDINQSKRLAEILPMESADMFYTLIDQGLYLEVKQGIEPSKDDIPCWSLAALLDIIKKAIGYTLQTTYNKNPKVFIECELGDKPYSIESTEYDNPVDACYEMIVKLHEQKLL